MNQAQAIIEYPRPQDPTYCLLRAPLSAAPRSACSEPPSQAPVPPADPGLGPGIFSSMTIEQPIADDAEELLDQARADGYEGEDYDEAEEWLQGRAEDRAYHREAD